MKSKVAIIMGSDSDLAKMKDASRILKEFDVNFEIKIVSAHRSPKFMFEYAEKAERRGVEIIIAAAGGAAHLPGMVASISDLPVIGVPINQNKLEGIDALLSIAQMPKGVPVATMAIDNSYNAGLLAVRMLARDNPKLKRKLKIFKMKLQTKVRVANQNLVK
ncbi:MAG: 5-(carboxyamino)imidazole ribonucleotide mutase [Pseudomonadota bacterium]|nr:5-(carboxyamino)imidazole ribonucleotide mutase [Pseudomonadota bacterium]